MEHTRIKLIPLLVLYLLACSAGGAVPVSVPVIKEGNERYARLNDISAHYGMKMTRPARNAYALENRQARFLFTLGARKVECNQTQIWFNAPIKVVRGFWSITETDLKMVVDPILRPEEYLKTHGARIVVLDPGHGGEDSGALSPSGLQEKHLTLDVCRRIRKILVNEGLKVYLTRDNDRYITLTGRCQIADTRKADLFVSIHFNSADNSQAQGFETYVITAPGYPTTYAAPEQSVQKVAYKGNGQDGANTFLGYSIQKASLKKVRNVDRGLRHARYAVLKHAPCTAVLVECGFLTNGREEKQLKDNAHLDRISEGIAKGILDYVNKAKATEPAKSAEKNMASAPPTTNPVSGP